MVAESNHFLTLSRFSPGAAPLSAGSIRQPPTNSTQRWNRARMRIVVTDMPTAIRARK
ncbi:hypothetical protein EDD31_0636 [Bogoriella caseilytica]|uniref:Uncharacterized protein n=1 Tax=Bogoriella caseilytica TaxID=56055 RepID=A0A3N2BAI8_9MICO|nr:hypothetical protein EDD31_0636 [Bogoriella caseilytica]